jgi:tetratricopeptide (TPR) repeat protein
MAGVAFLGAGQAGRAETILRRALALDSEGRDTRVRAELARCLMQQDRLDEAAAILERNLQSYPRDVDLLRERAVLDLLQGDAAAAERRIRDLLATGPFHVDLLGRLADALAAQGHFAEAEPVARRAATMYPDRPNLIRLAWILIAGDLDVTGGFEIAHHAREAPDDFYRASRTYPFTPSAEHALGLGHLKQGRYEEAVRYLEQAATRRPDRPSIQEHLRQARTHL